MRRCLHRVHRFSPGYNGAEMICNGDLAAECGHWALFEGEHVAPSCGALKPCIERHCHAGRSDAVRCMVSKWRVVHVNSVDEYGWTGLHFATLHSRENVMRLLLHELGARDIATSEAEGVHASSLNLPLWRRVSGREEGSGDGGPRPVVAQAEVVGEIVNDIEANNGEELMCSRVCDAVKLFGRGVLTERVTGPGSILHAAARRGFTALCRVCLELGSNVQPANDYGLTPLSLAAMYGHMLCTSVILDHGADIDQCDVDDMKPLFVASMNRRIDCVRLLLRRGADVHAANVAGWTPLIVACDNSDTECVRLVLSHGARIEQTSKAGQSPLCVACWAGSVECARICIDHGADVNHKDRRGWTPLLFACDQAHRSIALLLLVAGADPTARNGRGETAADKASAGRKPDRELSRALEAAQRDRQAGIATIKRLLGH